MRKMLLLVLASALLIGCANVHTENTTEALKAFSALTGTTMTLEPQYGRPVNIWTR